MSTPSKPRQLSLLSDIERIFCETLPRPVSKFTSTDSTGFVAGTSKYVTQSLKAHLESDEMDHDKEERKQLTEVIRVMIEYIKNDALHAIKYSSTLEMYRDQIITYKYINKRLSSVAAFRHDRAGATNAIKRAIQTLIDAGAIIECGRTNMIDTYGTAQKAYTFTAAPILR